MIARKYSTELKEKLVELLNAGVPAKALEAQYNVPSGVINSWRTKARKKQVLSPQNGAKSALEIELERLVRQLEKRAEKELEQAKRRVERDLDVQKKKVTQFLESMRG